MLQKLALSSLLALVTLTPAWADDYRGDRQPRRSDERERSRERSRDDRTVWLHAGGSFEKQRGDRWLEFRANGDPIRWREVDRTRDFVELYDPNRDMYVRLHDDAYYQRTRRTGWTRSTEGYWD